LDEGPLAPELASFLDEPEFVEGPVGAAVLPEAGLAPLLASVFGAPEFDEGPFDPLLASFLGAPEFDEGPVGAPVLPVEGLAPLFASVFGAPEFDEGPVGAAVLPEEPLGATGETDVGFAFTSLAGGLAFPDGKP
jgi:hypothetical protein